jgi:hypothetical protein
MAAQEQLRNSAYEPQEEQPNLFGEDPTVEITSALDVQVGGDHYKAQGIQPIAYIFANNLGFCEGNVVKYVTRYKLKNGVQDLKKARHYLDMLIEQVENSNAV